MQSVLQHSTYTRVSAECAAFQTIKVRALEKNRKPKLVWSMGKDGKLELNILAVFCIKTQQHISGIIIVGVAALAAPNAYMRAHGASHFDCFTSHLLHSQRSSKSKTVIVYYYHAVALSLLLRMLLLSNYSWK